MLTKPTVPSLILVAMLAILWALTPTTAVTYDDPSLLRHALSTVSHANIFHLLANCYCILLMRFPARWLTAFAIAVIATYIPSPVWSWQQLSFTIMPTCGASGAILAAITIAFAQKQKYHHILRYIILPILPLTLIPNINTPIHLCCIAIATILTIIRGTPCLSRRGRDLRDGD